MGSCYSGLGSKTRPSASLQPTERSPKLKNRHTKSSTQESNSYVTETHCSTGGYQLTRSLSQHRTAEFVFSSFEELSYEDILRKDPASMSLANNKEVKRRIPIPSGKSLGALSKVAPNRHSQELVKSDAAVRQLKPLKIPAKEFLLADSNSSTSISSASASANASKASSLKSSSSLSSSTNSIVQSAIPKPKSRSSTPPIPIRRTQINSNVITYENNINSTAKLSNERLANHQTKMTNSNSNRNVSAPSLKLDGNANKFKTQITGLPRAQTAQMTANDCRGNANLNKSAIRSVGRIQSVQYYSKCQQEDGINSTNQQLSKPGYYYFGMNKQSASLSCPYKRPEAIPKPQPVSIPANGDKLSAFNRSLKFQTNFAPPFKQQFNDDKRQSEVDLVQQQQPKYSNHPNIEIQSSMSSNTRPKIDGQILKKKVQQNVAPKLVDVIPESCQKLKLHIATEKTINQSNKKVSNGKSPSESTTEHQSLSSCGTEGENRDFLDDEISDQPELVLSAALDQADLTIKSSLTELEALKSKQRHDSVSSTSSPSSANTVVSSPPTAVPTTFRRPRPLSFVESPDGSLGLDPPSYRAACQDLIGIKTLLFRLQGILQNAETVNPFEPNYNQNTFYHQLFSPDKQKPENVDSNQENLDLKRQIVFLQHQIEDKNRTIKLLQQQMEKYLNVNENHSTKNGRREMVNSATQTDRCKNSGIINPSALPDGSNGTLVSVCCSHVTSLNNPNESEC